MVEHLAFRGVVRSAPRTGVRPWQIVVAALSLVYLLVYGGGFLLSRL